MSAVPPATRPGLPRAGSALLRWFEHLCARPGMVVLALCFAQIVVWTVIPAVTALALPIDVIEGYLWGREWVLSTYKHPALPSWVLEISRIVTGTIGWPAYLVSQIFIAATLALVYLLGRELMDAKHGAAAALLMTGVFYFSWFSAEFNHNIAQMPFWIGVVWALWHATRTNTYTAWLLVSAFSAACVYTKLSCAVLLLTGSLWIMWDVRARRTLATPAPWLALAAFGLLIAPLLLWLWRNNFQPLDYAERRATSASSVAIPEFLLGHVGRHAVMLGMLGYAGLLWTSPRAAAEPKSTFAIAPDVFAYLLIMTLGPLLILMGASVAMGMQLKPAWTASMSTLSGLLAVALCSPRVTHAAYVRLTAMAAVVLVSIVTIYGYDAMTGSRDAARYRPQQAAWPAVEIANHALGAWAKATSAPLRIVVGENRIAGIAALAAPSLPSLMTEADAWRSPWITPERIQREGMLLVWGQPGGVDPRRMRALAGDTTIESVHIPWPRAPGKPPLNLFLAVIPPQAVTQSPKDKP